MVEIGANSNTSPGATPSNPLTPSVTPPPEFSPVPPGSAYDPQPRSKFRIPYRKTDAMGTRGLGTGIDPLYLELPAGDAYVLQVEDGAPLFDSFVLPWLLDEGMSLHLFDGSEDIKLLAGMVYDLPGDGVSSFALLGDPPSLVVGLLFNTDDPANIGEIYGAAYALADTATVPEPSPLSLLAIGMLAMFGLSRRRRGVPY